CGTEYREGFFECADCHIPFKEQKPIHNEPYLPAWQEFRKLRMRKNIVGFGGFALVAIAVGIGFSKLAECLGILWILIFSVVSGQFHNWPCPECGQRFQRYLRTSFDSECRNCGLPRWAVNSRGRTSTDD